MGHLHSSFFYCTVSDCVHVLHLTLSTNSTLLTMGDMMDVATSPNDPIFSFHHANVDRMNMQWQALTLTLNVV